ncbi:hypothetical protein Aple_004370 [Acrocarpospora pleiomorpha]|uniref:Tetratrico peptide repeat group 5 domain-containing protein n=2 Tax=Acrocarpospora pleiomorpha TaxID=90975 RepID=A0A5M3X9Y2_9ACTN|nr:hypothetical protein Aple_004370 [Acrocarpospora pleiomorpha]
MKQGRCEEAVDLWRAHTEDDAFHAYGLFSLLLQHGQLEEATDILRGLLDEGDSTVVQQLAKLLVKQGRVEEAIELWRVRADHGHEIAELELAVVMARSGQEDTLRALVATGSWLAAERLVAVLVDLDRVREAADVLQVHVDNGDGYAATRLAELLTEQGQEEEALKIWRVLADGESGAYAATRLAKLLAEQGGEDELRARVDAGDHGAAEQFIAHFADKAPHQEVERLRRHGLLPHR